MPLLLLILASSCPLAAAEPIVPTTSPPLAPAPVAPASTPRAAFLRSLAGAPAVQAAQERIHAARQTAGAAGRLPDPMLGVGYASKSTTMDRWPMVEVMLEQPLPRWGERDARRAKARAETAMSEAELLDALGEIAAEVATMLADADAARAKLVLVEGQIARATTLQATIAARVATGTGTMADQLGVKTRLAALAVERDTMQRMVNDAEQDVLARLGLPPTAALPPFSTPDRTAVVLDRIPGVLAAKARTADADAMFREARASRYPETSVGLRYEREQQPNDAMDTVGLTFRISLPLWQGASDTLEEASYARRRAAQREVIGWEYRAQALLGRAERAATVAASARTAAEGTKARLDAEYDAMIRAASTQNGITLVSLLDVLDRLSEAERLVIEAEAAARQADASVWRLSPPDWSTLAPEGTQP